GRGNNRRLICLGEFVPLGDVHDVVGLAATLPPAWIVIVLGHFDEAELLVIIRATPFGRIERAFLKRWIDIAGRELLRHGAHLAQNRASKSTDAKFEPLEVI